MTISKGRLTLLDLCVDVPEGNLAKGYLQLWGCGRGNPNQVFHLASW